MLVVEDDPALLNLTVSMLKAEGYAALPAASPEEAARLAGEHAGEIHVLLTDVVLPGMNGRELESRIRQVRPAVKSLFMSGYTANVIAHHGVLDAGVAFLAKPFSRCDLAVKIRSVLGSGTRSSAKPA
ncbi:MAG: response regulator [Kiritimatiellia bacterium]|nr:response regulator [Kiritimatiellia bacterium]